MILIYENDRIKDRRYFVEYRRVDSFSGDPRDGRKNAVDWNKCDADFILCLPHAWSGYVVRVLKEGE